MGNLQAGNLTVPEKRGVTLPYKAKTVSSTTHAGVLRLQHCGDGNAFEID
jgi:hypothetical protein